MSAAHTPGPWHWDSDPVKGDPLDRVRYRITATGKTVTQCYYSSSDPQAEWDARLIAATPDLLAFVREFLADYGSEDGMYSMKHYARKAHELVAKATGGAL